MNEGAKQAYLDQKAAQLKEWSAKVDVLKARVTQGTAGIRIEFHNQIESWQQKEPLLRQKIEELRSAGTDTFESVKSKVQHAWDEVSTLVESLGDKKE